MRIPYNVTGEKRKALARVISETIGAEAVYKYMPTCAYEVGPYTVTKDGALEFEEGTDCGAVLAALAAAGYEADTEPVALTVTVPIGSHTGETLRNLVSLVFTRGGLINRALGTSFRVDGGLMEALKAAEISGTEDFLRAVGAYEDEHGSAVNGLIFTPEDITFASLPETAEPEVMRAFTELCAMMNKQALAQKRIQAKAVNEENEKYALRIWLTRLGMNGAEFKEARKILMANLTGHCAFRTPAEEAKWKARQAEKREALKAAKAETAAEEQKEVETA